MTGDKQQRVERNHTRLGIFIITAVLSLTTSLSWADSGDEIIYKEPLPESLLKEIRGTVWHQWDWDNPKPWHFYKSPTKDAKPIGGLLREDVMGISYNTNGFGFRFPVLDKKNGFVFIISHLERDAGVWVKIEKDNPPMMFSEKSQENVFLNIFPWGEKHRTLYEAPSSSSSHMEFWEGEIQYLEIEFIQTIRIQHDWIEIQGLRRNKDAIPLGWIRAHDDAGRLQIWPYYADDC